MKICRICDKLKSLSEFGSDPRRLDGKRSECFECRKLEYNPEEKSAYNKKWYQKNKEKQDRKSKEWVLKNLERSNVYKNNWEKQKAATSIQHRLKRSLRARLRGAIKNNQKSGSAIKDLGCSIEFLKQYLEKQFVEGMSWDNYGNREGQWSIDHIIALSNVDLTSREQLLKVCHYTNLKPMWQCGVGGNISKGNKL